MIFKKLLIILLLAGIGFAGDMNNAMNALDKNDNKTALKLFQKGCNGGNAIACFDAGLMHDIGHGIKQDSFKAAELYSKACSLGFGTGCSNIGVFYANGRGVKQSYEKALKYYGQACDLKDEIGCENYAELKTREFPTLK